ncbi:hypothetical protein CEE36_09945 [candidate division TA06 bacterium B3_TA06]|uniref:Uncharacterized protein n=1 Tax=candidate division TA06 bacterium B3_TA06 TaxID=2012487 RepID=A0A532UY81_UNCT6|nr:MAG: hypothetical protein CEE36_09945 [candidate division TA06 bacterium B3_TA06]
MHKRWTPGSIWGTSILLALTFSAVIAQETKAYTDTLDLTEYARDELFFMSQITRADSLPIFFAFHDSLWKPASGVLCVVETKKGRFEKTSDKNGEVVFWIPRKARRITGFKVYSCQPVKGEFPLTGSAGSESTNLGLIGSLTVFFKLFIAARNAPLYLSYGMPELEEDGIRVLYPSEFNKQAGQVLDAVLKGRKVIESELDMELKPVKVVLKQDTATFELHIGGGWWTTPEIDSSYVFGTIPHEWVESSLGSIYNVDGRWIGDGLANYAAFEIEKRYYPEGYSRLHRDDYPRYDPKKTYDLRTWKEAQIINLRGGRSVDVFGYLLAPYFWAKVVEKSGNPELIPRFLEECRTAENKSSDTAIAILSRLSGLDIEEEMVITGKEFRENVGRYWPEPQSSSVNKSEKE